MKIVPGKKTNESLLKLSHRVYFEFLYVLYSYICAFIAFLETAIIFICCVYVDNNFSVEANCYGNGILFLCYLGFDILFETVESPPPLTYKIGVWLYTIGYAGFTIPSLLTLLGKSTTFVFEMYLAGSLLFTFGSMFLLIGLDSVKSFDLQTMFVIRHAAWWGAIQFLIGSICFVIYSFGIAFPYGKSLWLFETTDQWLALFGVTTFLIGRSYFLIDASIAIKISWENLLETEYAKRDHDLPQNMKLNDGPAPTAIQKRLSTSHFAQIDDASVSYLRRGSVIMQNDMTVIKFTSRRHSQLYLAGNSDLPRIPGFFGIPLPDSDEESYLVHETSV